MDNETTDRLIKKIMRDLVFSFTEVVNRNGLLTTEQFAKKHNLAISTVWAACKTGRVECFKFQNKWLIPMDFKYKKYQRRQKPMSLVEEYRLK